LKYFDVQNVTFATRVKCPDNGSYTSVCHDVLFMQTA